MLFFKKIILILSLFISPYIYSLETDKPKETAEVKRPSDLEIISKRMRYWVLFGKSKRLDAIYKAYIKSKSNKKYSNIIITNEDKQMLLAVTAKRIKEINSLVNKELKKFIKKLKKKAIKAQKYTSKKGKKEFAKYKKLYSIAKQYYKNIKLKKEHEKACTTSDVNYDKNINTLILKYREVAQLPFPNFFQIVLNKLKDDYLKQKLVHKSKKK